MYCGTNPSAIRSREWITESLLLILKEKRYKQITVKDICIKADLSRQTFYQIFDSKDEVLEYQFKKLFEEFYKSSKEITGLSLNRLSCLFFDFFRQHRDYMDVLVENHMTYLIERQFERYLPEIEMFRQINETEIYPEYSVCYVAGALSQILIHWYENGMKIPVKAMGELTENLVTGRNFVSFF